MSILFLYFYKPVKKLVSIGLPSSAQSIITNISFLVMTSLSNGIGVTAGAAVGVVGKFNSIAILPIVAMSSSVSSIAAQNIAAEKYDRALKSAKYGIIISLCVGAVVFLASQLFAEGILTIFKSDDAEVIKKGAAYLRAFSFDYLCVAFLFSMNSLIIASGHSTFSMLSSATSALILRAPVAYFLSKTSLEIAGVGYAAPAASLVAVLMAGGFLISGKWKHNKTGIRREN